MFTAAIIIVPTASLAHVRICVHVHVRICVHVRMFRYSNHETLLVPIVVVEYFLFDILKEINWHRFEYC